jgi:hypothetical protein
MSAGCHIVNVSQSLVLPLASSSCTSCLCRGHRKVEKQRSSRSKMGWSRKCYDNKCMLPITLECCRNELPLRSGHAPITIGVRGGCRHSSCGIRRRAVCSRSQSNIPPRPCEGSSGFIDSLQCSVGYIEVSFWLWNPMLVEYASRFGPRAIPKRTDLFLVLMLTRLELEGSNPDRFVMIQI